MCCEIFLTYYKFFRRMPLKRYFVNKFLFGRRFKHILVGTIFVFSLYFQNNFLEIIWINFWTLYRNDTKCKNLLEDLLFFIKMAETLLHLSPLLVILLHIEQRLPSSSSQQRIQKRWYFYARQWIFMWHKFLILIFRLKLSTRYKV